MLWASYAVLNLVLLDRIRPTSGQVRETPAKATVDEGVESICGHSAVYLRTHSDVLANRIHFHGRVGEALTSSRGWFEYESEPRGRLRPGRAAARHAASPTGAKSPFTVHSE